MFERKKRGGENTRGVDDKCLDSSRNKSESDVKIDRITTTNDLQRKNIKIELGNNNQFSEIDIIRISQLSKEQGKRAVLQLDDQGKILKIYDSLTNASKSIGISSKTIRDVAKGRYKHTGGFCWMYADEFEFHTEE